MVERCYICNKSRKNLVSLHKFPSADRAHILQKWLTALQLEPGENLPSWVVCSEHFEETDFAKSGRLKLGAYPSLYLDGLPEKQELRKASAIKTETPKKKQRSHTPLTFREEGTSETWVVTDGPSITFDPSSLIIPRSPTPGVRIPAPPEVTITYKGQRLFPDDDAPSEGSSIDNDGGNNCRQRQFPDDDAPSEGSSEDNDEGNYHSRLSFPIDDTSGQGSPKENNDRNNYSRLRFPIDDTSGQGSPKENNVRNNYRQLRFYIDDPSERDSSDDNECKINFSRLRFRIADTPDGKTSRLHFPIDDTSNQSSPIEKDGRNSYRQLHFPIDDTSGQDSSDDNDGRNGYSADDLPLSKLRQEDPHLSHFEMYNKLRKAAEENSKKIKQLQEENQEIKKELHHWALKLNLIRK